MEALTLRILALLRERGPMAPGDAVAALGEPRYRVLAAFHCLEELGLARKIYERGTYKLYHVSLAGETLLELARERQASTIIEEALISMRGAHHQAASEQGREAV